MNFDFSMSTATENGENQIFGFKKVSQKQAKRARARGQSFDETPFRRMGVSRPRSQLECNKLTEELLVGQKEILQVCALRLNCAPLMTAKNLIRNTAHHEVKEYFLSSILTKDRVHTTTMSKQEVDNTPSAADPLSTPTEDPTTSQYHGTLSLVKYLDDMVEGFGEWKILLSTRCVQDLRKVRHGNAKRFEIIKKKMT